MVYKPPMNMKNIVIDLLESGQTETQLAEIVNSSQPAINRIKTGEVPDPKGSITIGLLMLHMKRCRGKKRPFNVRVCE